MAQQGSYPIGTRVLVATDTVTGVVTSLTADIPLNALATFVQNYIGTNTPLTVPQGGTGATTLSGYLFGNGTLAITASTTIPSTAITGLGTMALQPASAVAITGGTITGVTISGGSVTATNIAGGATSQILVQSAAGATTFIAAPTIADTVLTWNGSVFGWAAPGAGTVTSVAVSGGTTGLTTSGGPITSSGTIILAGTLAVANGGTGSGTASGARTNLGAAASGTNSDITSLSGLTSVNGHQIAGMTNRLVNGAMLIDQQNSGAVQTFTAAAAVAYCVDQWYASCTGANITGQRASSTTGGYTLTGAASNTGTLFGQRIESYSVSDLVNTTVTHQIKLSSTSVTSVTWNAYYATVQDTFSTKTLIATGTFTISSTPTVYSASFNAGANAANGIAVEYITGALLAGQTLTFGAAQFEAGSVATVFERRPYEFEFGLCQRYYEVLGPNSTGSLYIGNYAAAAGAETDAPVRFQVRKRSIPTVSCPGAWTLVNVSSGVVPNFPDVDGFALAIVAGSTGRFYAYNNGTAAVALANSRL